MKKRTLAKLGGFAVAAATTAALVGFAANGTGAYFTDSHTGNIATSTGTLAVTLNPSDGNLSFANLLPGEYQTDAVQYTAHTTSSLGEDIWLVFSPPTANGSVGDPSEAFTGRPDDGTGGGLGRYGHFAVTSDGGASFSSYNLSSNRLDDPSAPCPTDSNGEGGGGGPFLTPLPLAPYCSPVKPILLDSGLTNGATGTAQLTFGFTGLLKGPQSTFTGNVGYKIVATQHGILPGDPNNP